VDESGCVEAVVIIPALPLELRQPVEFIVDQREQLIECLPVPGLQVVQKATDRFVVGVAHQPARMMYSPRISVRQAASYERAQPPATMS
jgi:hypothetical protein